MRQPPLHACNQANLALNGTHDHRGFAVYLPYHKADVLYSEQQQALVSLRSTCELFAIVEVCLRARDTIFSNTDLPWCNSASQQPKHEQLTSSRHGWAPDPTFNGHSFCPGGATYYAMHRASAGGCPPLSKSTSRLEMALPLPSNSATPWERTFSHLPCPDSGHHSSDGQSHSTQDFSFPPIPTSQSPPPGTPQHILYLSRTYLSKSPA